MKSFDFTDFETAYSQTLQLAPKNKYKKLTELAMNIVVTENLSLEHIDLYLKVVNLAKKVSYRSPALNKTLQLLVQTRIAKLGVDVSQLETLFEKKFKVSLESTTVCIADKQFFSELYEEDSVIKAAMQKGERLYFATDADGDAPIQVRVVNLEYPLFSESERKKLVNFSEFYILNLPTGILTIGDATDPQWEATLTPGQYRVSINLTKAGKFIVCLAKIVKMLEHFENNPEIPTLE